jgi:hypothetical protein
LFLAVTIVTGLACDLIAQTSGLPSEEVVHLPQLTVSAKRIIPPPESWQYTKAGGMEVLSNASDGRTQDLVRDFIQYLNVLHSVVPATRVKNAPPLKIIICGRVGFFSQFVPPGQSLNQMAVSYRDGEQSFIVANRSDDTISVVDELAPDENGLGGGAAGGASNFDTGNSIDMSEASMSNLIGNVDDDGNEVAAPSSVNTPGVRLDMGEQMNRAYLKLVFSQMKPQPPVWFEEGMTQLFMRMRFSGNDVTFGEIQGLEQRDNTVTARELQTFNVELARTKLIPFDKFFEITRDSNAYKNSGAGTSRWALQSQAFVHYCLYRRGTKLQEGFAKFLAASSEGRADETVFKQCFKMSYRDMELEIRNYIEYTDFKYLRYTFKEDTRPAAPELREAADFEVGRLKGEALRLAGKPDTGRSELLGPYTRKRIDPQLLAALGLDEIERGTPQRARALLEEAVKGKVIRPRAYVVLGRLYLAEWLENENSENTLTSEQFGTLEKLVQAARVQYPPMSAVYALYAEALGLAPGAATVPQLGILVEGCKAYPGNLDLVYKTAHLIIKSGDRHGARPLVQLGQKTARSEDDKSRFEKLADEILEK